MFVKVGNQVFDSENEPITIKFEGNEKMIVKRLSVRQDILTLFPKGLEKTELDAFNRVFMNGTAEEKAAPDDGAIPIEAKQVEATQVDHVPAGAIPVNTEPMQFVPPNQDAQGN